MPGFIKKLTALPKEKQKPEIENALGSTLRLIIETDIFCVASSSTNASNWKVTQYEILSVAIDTNAKEVDVELAYTAAGDQAPGKPAFGNEIEGEAKAILDDDGKVNYVDVTAEIAG